MFNNIGGKIKVVAQILCYGGIALSILGCFGNIITAINNYYPINWTVLNSKFVVKKVI